MKYLAIDFGLRRIGLAACDEAEIFASPHATREYSDGKKELARLLADLIETLRTLQIEGIVIGLPRDSSGEVCEMETRTREFAAQLEGALRAEKLELKIEWWDERFSTSQVLKSLRDAGVSQKKAKAATGNDSIDARAAALILQDFLDAKKLRIQLQTEPEA